MPVQRETILIVEFDGPTRELYRRELSREFQVFDCSEAKPALDYLQNQKVSLIILEPVRPDGQGWSFLQLLRKSPVTSSIPVILCSIQDERRRGIELGVAAYLVKPVLPATLRDAVKSFT